MNHPEFGDSIVAHKPGNEWQDGPCKFCTCEVRNNETESICSTRECISIESHSDYNEYDLQAVPGTGDSCCPEIKRLACKFDDRIFKVIIFKLIFFKIDF